MKEPRVYILSSKPNGVLYVGVTGDLHGRMAEHDQALFAGFTKRYGVKHLVYYEFHETFDDAIADFSVEYADQAQRDYRTFVKAIRHGRLKAERLG